MSKPVRVLMVCVVLAGVLLNGCGGWGKMTGHRGRPVQAVQIPAPKLSPPSDVLGYATLVAPSDDLFARWGEWLSAIKPELDAARLRSEMEKQGIRPADFAAGSKVSYFLLAPGADARRLIMAGLFPVAAGSPSVQSLMRGMHADAQAEHAGYLIASRNQPGVDRAVSLGDALIALNKEPMAGDAEVFINAKALMERYGAKLRTWSAAMQMMIGSMPAQGAMDKAFIQKIFAAEMQAFQDLADQTDFISLSAGVDRARGGAALEASALLRAKAGSALAGAMNKGPVRAPDMTGYLTPEAPLRYQQSMRDLGQFSRVYLHYLGLALGSGGPEMERFQNEVSESVKPIGELHSAIAIDSVNGKLIYEAVMTSSDNEALMNLIRQKTTKWVNEGPIHGFYENMGIKVSITEQPARRLTRRQAGWFRRRPVVNHYLLQVQPTSAMPAPAAQQLEKLYGHMEMQVVPMGRLVLLTLNRPVDELVARVRHGGGTGIEAMKAYPAGGVFYADVRPGELMALLKTLMPPEAAGQLPTTARGTTPVTMFATCEQGLAWGKARFPKGSIAPGK